MSIGENLKILRKRLKKTQEDVALDLGFNRSTYSGYENSVAQPNLENMVELSRYYKVSIEDLIKLDFNSFLEKDWIKHENQDQDRARGGKLRILASVINESNEEVIELIPENARAGYTVGYSDPSYFQDFPTIRLPFLSKEKKYRAFPIQGDSMPPVSDGSIVVGEFLPDWMQIRSGKSYVIVTQSEGIVFKKVYHHADNPGFLHLISINTLYEPYEISFSDVLEIWTFVSYIATEIPEVKLDDLSLMETIRILQTDVKRLLDKK